MTLRQLLESDDFQNMETIEQDKLLAMYDLPDFKHLSPTPEILDAPLGAKSTLGSKQYKATPGEIVEKVGVPLAMAGAGLVASPLSVPAGIGFMGLMGAGAKGYELAGRTALGDLPPGETSMTAGKQMLKEGTIQGTIEGVGRGLAYAIPKAVTGIGRGILGTVKAAERPYIKTLEKLGVRLTPGGLTGRRPVVASENALQKFLFSQPLVNRVENNAKLMHEGLNEIRLDLTRGLGEKQAGEIAQKFTDLARMNYDRQAATYFAAVDALNPKGASVDTLPIKQWASSIAEKFKNVQGLGETSAIKKIYSAMQNLGDTISFQEAMDLRSAVLSELRSAPYNERGQARAIATKAQEMILKVMDDSADQLDYRPLKEAYDIARKDYAKGMATHYNDTINEIAETENPEAIVQLIFRPRNVSDIQKLKAVIPTRQFNDLRSVWVDDIFKKSLSQSEEFTAKTILKNMEKVGRESLDEIFPGGEWSRLKDVLTAVKFGQKQMLNPNSASSLIVLQQILSGGGIIMTIANPGIEGKGKALRIAGYTGILLTPAILSKVAVSPVIYKMLMEGLEAGSKSKIALPLAGRLIPAIKEAGGIVFDYDGQNLPQQEAP